MFLNLIQKNNIAKLLQVSPEALAEFEKQYQKQQLENGDLSLKDQKAMIEDPADTPIAEQDLIARIVDELVSDTRTYMYQNGKVTQTEYPALPESKALSITELNALNPAIRPQATHNGILTDMPYGSADQAVMNIYAHCQKTKNPKQKQQLYGMFRNGLDTQDINPIIYNFLDSCKGSMGYWFPRLVEANAGRSFFKIPDTIIAKIPPSLLQLTRIDYSRINPTTHAIVNKYAQKVFDLDTAKDYFVKTGIYSSKFDFRNAHVVPSEVPELGDYLLYIHNESVMQAIHNRAYGVATTTEWVVREYIENADNLPMIYNGLPLRTEYRVFIDCDEGEVLAVYPYWEPETMKDRFSKHADKDTPNMTHDYVIYKSQEPRIMSEFHKNKDLIKQHVQDLLPDLNLSGQWSLDIMQNDDTFWLIDMAIAQRSAFYDTAVPKNKQRTLDIAEIEFTLPGA